MDKTRDVRRGAGRFYRQITKKSERAKKIRRLSCFDGAEIPSKGDCGMGCCALSDRGNGCSSLSESQAVVFRNFFDGFNCVDHHAPVPRRLRSATKKRDRESISPPLPDSKEQNHKLGLGGMESLEKDGIKGTLLNLVSRLSLAKQADSDWSPNSVFSKPITKDEEEVVETLYALAGMFLDNETMVATVLHREFSGANASVVPEMGKIPPATGIKENSMYEAAEPISLNRISSRGQPEFSENKMSRTAADGTSLPLDSLVKGTPLSAKAECNDENPHSFHKISLNHGLSMDSGLKQSQQQVTPQERTQEIGLGATTIESELSKPSYQHITKDSGKNGLTLWPGLSSELTTGGASHKPSELADAKIPAWLGTATSASRPGSLENFSSKKFSKAAIDKKTMKRCAAHVHISHLTLALKMPESNGSLSLQAIELNPCEVSKKKVLASLNSNKSNRVKIEIDGTVTGSRFGNLTANRNFCEAEATIFIQQKKPHKDQNQIVPASGRQSSTKHGFDFLSLSAGSNCIDTDKDGNVCGSMSHLHDPYVQSILPFSAPQTLHFSRAYVSKNSSKAPAAQQVQLHLAQHLNCPLCSSFHENHSGISRQQQHHQFWAAQVAAQCSTFGTSSARNQLPSWLHGKQEYPTMISTDKTIFPAPLISMDAISTKYSAVAQHQQPLKAISSLCTEKVRVQEHQLAPLYEGGVRGFRPNSTLPLQLLCNESL